MLQVSLLERLVLRPIDFTVKSGECLAVTGPSGAGKTLLLRAIADLDPNQGTVSLDGQDRRSMAAPVWRKRAVMIPAESGWWAEAVGEHFCSTSGAVDVLEELGLPVEALGWQVLRLSTGERHRLAIARALLLEPDALLLDEPTAALDEDAASQVEEVLHRQLKGGKSIVLVTHDPAQVKRLANSQIVLKDGRAGAQETIG